MEITKLIEVLKKAKEDLYVGVIRANQDFSKGGEFIEVDYSENQEGESGDVVLIIPSP